LSHGLCAAALLLANTTGTCASTQLSRAQAVALTRQWVVKGPLGAGRAALIKWLLEAGSRSGLEPSPAMVRQLRAVGRARLGWAGTMVVIEARAC
jgi:predicted ATPase